MRSTRPPRRFLAALAFACAAVSGAAGVADAQDLNLPDLILPGNLRPDIVLPSNEIKVSEPWTVPPLRYRRLYPVAAVVSPDIPSVPVRIEGLGPIAVFGAVSGAGEPDRLNVVSIWSADAVYDIQEGLALSGGHQAADADRLSMEVFLPVAVTPKRAWQAGLKWERSGALSGILRTGGKYTSGFAGYGLADFRLDRPMGSPDSYELLFLSHGGSRGGLGGRLGIRLLFPMGEGGWHAGTILGGGGSYDSSGGSWQADAGLYTGFRTSGGRLSLSFGLQSLFRPNQSVSLNPLLEFLWRPRGTLTLFASSEYAFGTEGTDAIVLEGIESYEGEIPVHAVYTLGVEAASLDGSVLRLSLDAGYGRYAFGSGEAVFLQDDIRTGLDASLRIPAGSGAVTAAALLDWYVGEDLVLWTAETAWDGSVLTAYIYAGSEDALLGGGLPGIRGEMPIIGIGTEYRIGKGWTAGLNAYTGLPWESPSLVFSAGWRN